MTNLAICEKGSNVISYFLRDCVRKNNSFYGSNIDLVGVKLNLFDFFWTNDDVKEIYNIDNKLTGYNKTTSELTASGGNLDIDKPTRSDYLNSIGERKKISDLTFNQIDQYIDNNIIDIQSVKVVLKMFGRVILSLCRQIDYEIK